MFDELYINDYCNFNTFKMIFSDKESQQNKVNLNLLVGKNGSGKSSLLDALYELAQYNLKSNTGKYDNTCFDYKLLFKGKIINTNMQIKNVEYLSSEERNKHKWDSIIRLHTGHTKRQIYSYGINAYSLTTQTTKWALLAYITSEIWYSLYKCTINAALWDELQDIIFGKNKHITPQFIWIDIQKDNDIADINQSIIENIRKPDFSRYIGNNITRYYWALKFPIIEPHNTTIKQNKTTPLSKLSTFLMKLAPTELSENMEGQFIDTGFLYTQGDSNKLLPDSFLSDGEHGFFTRFALLMLLREENRDNKQHYLILLDEPETHFNENWKTSFLNLVCKIFENTNHDIFIATHSAMLVTDAKQDEIYRLENKDSGIMTYPVPINTFGANIIDIGKTLFQMEADIGERSKQDIEKTINGIDIENNNTKFVSNEQHKKALNKLLKQVGAGEWRWKIRSKINQLEKADSCCNYKKKENNNNDC